MALPIVKSPIPLSWYAYKLIPSNGKKISNQANSSSTMLLLLLLAIPIIIIYYHIQKQKSLHPPGPPALPFIGNLHQFLNSTFSPHEYLWQLSKKYGPVMSMRFGSVPVLIISSASAAEQALKTHDLAFSGRPQFLSLQKLSYNGLDMAFTAYGEYWREMRKIGVLHLLGPKRVQSFRHIREDEVSILIKDIAELANSSQLINVSEILLALSRNLICRIGFGKRPTEEQIFNELFHEAQSMMAGVFVSDYFPLFQWVDKLRGMIRRLEKVAKEFDLFYQEIIDEHLKKSRPESSPEDIVDILLKLRDEKSSPFDLSFDHIKGMLMNVLLGGTDTVAAIIIWTMTALMQNPTIMDKVQEEIRNLIGNRGRVKEDDIQKLPYLKAVISETLRLHPPTPLLLPRETLQKCIIDGYEIQPKTLVYLNEWAISRDPKYWRDPDEFLPERFLGNVNIDYGGKNFALMPFGAGRRGCPGVSLGMATVELALANLLYSFDWELPPGMKKEDIDLDELPGFTRHLKNDLLLVAKSCV